MDSDYFETWAGLPEPLRSLINPFNEFPPIERVYSSYARICLEQASTLGLFLQCLQWQVDENGHLVHASSSEPTGSTGYLETQSTTSTPLPPHVATRSLAPASAVAFPYAIYRIVEKPENRSWIRWNEDGTELQFCDWNRLLDSLGRYGLSAKQKESVNKNFHDYGFKRLSDNRKRVPDNNGIVWCRFKHENFQRGKPDLVKNIYRRYRRPAN